jgi:hypothetical protein
LTNICLMHKDGQTLDWMERPPIIGTVRSLGEFQFLPAHDNDVASCSWCCSHERGLRPIRVLGQVLNSSQRVIFSFSYFQFRVMQR